MTAPLYDTPPMIDETPDPDELERRRRRLLFRATHRGTHESDLLIGGFVAARLATFTDSDIVALEALLELPDSDLADWLTGRQPIPEEQATPMLRAMRQACQRGGAPGTIG
jgi:antitoxin CptB